MSKLTILNDQGFALRNLPSNKFNDEKTKKISVWSFSAKNVDINDPSTYTPTLNKALTQLTEAGFKNLTITIANEELEIKQYNKILDNQIEKGQKAPRNKIEAQNILNKQISNMPDEEKEFEKEFWKEINHKCAGCTRQCKQSSRAVIYSCGAYQRAS